MPLSPPERCQACLLDATHTVHWHATRQRWSAWLVRNLTPGQVLYGVYCHWHATVSATQCNARADKKEAL